MKAFLILPLSIEDSIVLLTKLEDAYVGSRYLSRRYE